MIQDAFAMGPSAGGDGSDGPSFLISMAPFILMFLIMYLLLIRPQQKRQRDQQHMSGRYYRHYFRTQGGCGYGTCGG